MKGNKIFGIGTAFFVAAIMISSATLAAPITQKKAVENIEAISIEDMLYKDIDPSLLASNSDLLEFLWDLFNDPDFRDWFQQMKEDIINEILGVSVAGNDLIKSFLHVEETFSYDSLKKRIEGAESSNILYYIQDLLEVPDTYEEFEESNVAETETFMELLYDVDPSAGSGLHPLIESICQLIRFIAMFYAVPLAAMSGAAGLIIANYVTIILFGPILAHLILIEGCLDAVENEPELQDKLDTILQTSGIIGLITLGPPLVLFYAWIKGYIKQAAYDVLDIVIIRELISDTLETGENPPATLSIDGPDSAIVKTKCEFTAKVLDSDKISDGDIRIYRDYVQVGWDWDEDGNVDEWTSLENTYGDGTEIETEHKFTSKGTHKVKYLPRDNWGATGEWSEEFEIEITGTGWPIQKTFNHFFAEHFPILQSILSKLLQC